MAKVFIQESTLTNIGNAIREKTGKTAKIAPGNMPTEIKSIKTGGGGYNPTDAELRLNGDMTMAFAANKFNWVIENYGDRIYMANCYPLTKMFYECNNLISKIPFKIRYSNTQNNNDVSELFKGCSHMTELPEIENWKPTVINGLFFDCMSIREVPDSFVNAINWTNFEAVTSKYGAKAQQMFYGCKSLRKFPVGMIHFANTELVSLYHPYYSMADMCTCVDEIINIPVDTNTLKNDVMYSMFSSCNRVKRITFAPIDGTVNWSNQQISLTFGVGYVSGNVSDRITGYNSGITIDKQVEDNAAYEALKDDPDWFTTNNYYSRYDHDSAVETINSLPTTTGTGCTISFQGSSGGGNRGYINTLTEEEVAVAAAKGWTVSLI